MYSWPLCLNFIVLRFLPISLQCSVVISPLSSPLTKYLSIWRKEHVSISVISNVSDIWQILSFKYINERPMKGHCTRQWLNCSDQSSNHYLYKLLVISMVPKHNRTTHSCYHFMCITSYVEPRQCCVSGLPFAGPELNICANRNPFRCQLWLPLWTDSTMHWPGQCSWLQEQCKIEPF